MMLSFSNYSEFMSALRHLVSKRNEKNRLCAVLYN